MTMDYLNNNMTELDEIDTSSVDDSDTIDTDTNIDDPDCVESPIVVIDAEHINSTIVDNSEEIGDEQEPTSRILKRDKNGSHISFKGYGRCTCNGCKCPGYVSKGYGNVCDNCGHYYEKHW